MIQNDSSGTKFCYRCGVKYIDDKDTFPHGKLVVPVVYLRSQRKQEEHNIQDVLIGLYSALDVLFSFFKQKTEWNFLLTILI